MIKSYQTIIQDILGKDLMEYYNKLYKAEQLKLVLSLINEYKWFKNDKVIMNIKLNTTKENPIIIRTLKKETIESCKKLFS